MLLGAATVVLFPAASPPCLPPAGWGVKGDHWEAAGEVSSMPESRSKFEIPVEAVGTVAAPAAVVVVVTAVEEAEVVEEAEGVLVVEVVVATACVLCVGC